MLLQLVECSNHCAFKGLALSPLPESKIWFAVLKKYLKLMWFK
jgi:hypothetical protein